MAEYRLGAVHSAGNLLNGVYEYEIIGPGSASGYGSGGVVLNPFSLYKIFF